MEAACARFANRWTMYRFPKEVFHESSVATEILALRGWSGPGFRAPCSRGDSQDEDHARASVPSAGSESPLQSEQRRSDGGNRRWNHRIWRRRIPDLLEGCAARLIGQDPQYIERLWQDM